MNMSSIAKDHPSVEKEWQISIADRCDSCNAQAFVKVIGVTGELFFCGHHYNKIINNPQSYEKIMSFMYTIIDERERMNKEG